MKLNSSSDPLAPIELLRIEAESVRRMAEGIAPAEVQIIDTEQALGIVASHAASVESRANQDPKPKDRLMATLFVFANIKGLIPADENAEAIFHALAKQGSK